MGANKKCIAMLRMILARQCAGSAGPDHLDALRTQWSLADAVMDYGDSKEAARLLRDAIERGRRALGNNHSGVVAMQSGLNDMMGFSKGELAPGVRWDAAEVDVQGPRDPCPSCLVREDDFGMYMQCTACGALVCGDCVGAALPVALADDRPGVYAFGKRIKRILVCLVCNTAVAQTGEEDLARLLEMTRETAAGRHTLFAYNAIATMLSEGE